jgi:molecular chaperone DnaK
MSEIIIGIDLGTTNSEVAVVEASSITVIADAQGRRIIPSFVGVAEDGSVLVGEPAKNQYVVYPERTIKSIKRKMGSGEKVEMAGVAYTPQEISAIILRHLKAMAEAHLKRPVSKAVITVPAYFNDAQRQATREAGELAGLEVVRIINEPTAAALSYESDRAQSKRVLVYDLGGGTFDVSVVALEQGVVEVISSHGNNHLGGDDFDQKIVDRIVEHLEAQYAVDMRSAKPQAMARIVRAAEEAKKALSDQPYVSIEEEYIAEKDGSPVHLSLELERADYEQMIAPYIDETLEAVHIALRGANLTVSDIDEILLVGGATRTPLVLRRLEEDLGMQPRGDVNPDLCVAMGASIQAAMIGGGEAPSVLVDITPYTFGTSAVGELEGIPYPYMFVPIIRKNTPIPTSKSEVFFTMVDNQQAVDVNIYQGEDPDALRNVKIGEFLIQGLSKVPAGNPIVMRLDLDLDGILHVSAKEKKSGLAKSITIDNAISRFEGEEMAQAKERMRTLFGEVVHGEEKAHGEKTGQAGEREQHQAVVQARALVEKAERKLEGATPEDREDMVNLIEAIREALRAGDLDALEDPVAQLSDILYYLES